MNREQIMARYQQQIARIEGSQIYSSHAKQVMAAKAWKAAQGEMDTLRQDEVDAIRGRREQLQRKMFGRENTADAQTVIARRDANDRVAKLDNPRLATSQLRDAIRQGDRTMAQALAQRAATLNWTDVLETYADYQPDFRDHVNEYNELPDPDQASQWTISHGFAHVVPTPGILSNLSTTHIAGLAEQDLETA
ncbi:hypothetical protein [Streptomyces showdoensis]|uniref:Uncharacterized protein n=1 Tax=Streptomyces showdoensis TaxID=68268 RepID=A0A2P2GTU8_STREW|nr:hypothetical protein [Streptomyces showdoensis]KKZ74345.1 hypothetical protein VO63_07820 [Streptomyces showdoensis]